METDIIGMSEIADATIKSSLERGRKRIMSNIVVQFALGGVLLMLFVGSGIQTASAWMNNNDVTVSARAYTTVGSKNQPVEKLAYKYDGTEYVVPQGQFSWPNNSDNIQVKLDPRDPTNPMPVGPVPPSLLNVQEMVMVAVVIGMVLSAFNGMKALRTSRTMPDEEALEYLRRKYPTNKFRF